MTTNYTLSDIEAARDAAKAVHDAMADPADEAIPRRRVELEAHRAIAYGTFRSLHRAHSLLQNVERKASLRAGLAEALTSTDARLQARRDEAQRQLEELNRTDRSGRSAGPIRFEVDRLTGLLNAIEQGWGAGDPPREILLDLGTLPPSTSLAELRCLAALRFMDEEDEKSRERILKPVLPLLEAFKAKAIRTPRISTARRQQASGALA